MDVSKPVQKPIFVLSITTFYPLYSMDGEAIYYQGPHELQNIADGPQKLINLILKICH